MGAHQRPFLIELVGPPGAGKSSVCRALRARAPQVSAGPTLHRGRHAPRLVRDVAAVGLRVARHHAVGRGWTREMLVMAGYAQALPPVLMLNGSCPADVVVFDQGPIYTLTRDVLLDERLSGWRDATLRQWRELLDLVVWLEADDHVLVERINRRPTGHRLKGGTAASASTALARDRAVYGHVIQELDGGPRIMRFDTGATAAGDVVDAILAALPRPSAGSSP